MTALKPLPELTYQCPADITNDYDDRILKIPGRIKALKSLMHELESFTDARWWNSSVADLNACYLRGRISVEYAAETVRLHLAI